MLPLKILFNSFKMTFITIFYPGGSWYIISENEKDENMSKSTKVTKKVK